jgi:hypothetical protein
MTQSLAVTNEMILEIIEGYENLVSGNATEEGAKAGIVFVLNTLGISIEGINWTEEKTNEG